MDEWTGSSEPSIRMGELRVDRDGKMLRTLLGSCVGLALFDRRLKVGGLAHIVLPESQGKSDLPGKYVDTAVPELVNQLEKLAERSVQLSAVVAGGASMFVGECSIKIGEMNVASCEMLLQQLQIPIVARHCGGQQGRRMTFNTATGKVLIEIVGQHPMELS